MTHPCWKWLLFFTICISACAPATPALPPANLPPANLPPTASPAPTISPECAPGSRTNNLLSGGQTRTYLLHVPASYRPDQPVALVLGFHGNFGHADSFAAYSGFSPMADQAGFIIAYAQGAGNPPTWDTWQHSKDVQYTSDLIDRLETICAIDPARVFATGHSLGGGMINRLACDLAGRIAAIGSVSGAYMNAEPCTPTQPVAVLAVHGTADMDVFYNGVPPNGQTAESYFSIGTPIPQWASGWAKRNGCSEKTSIFFKKDPVSGQQWDNCRNGADVVLYTIRDGGHGWPASSADFSPPQFIWDFLSRHPLAPSGS